MVPMRATSSSSMALIRRPSFTRSAAFARRAFSSSLRSRSFSSPAALSVKVTAISSESRALPVVSTDITRCTSAVVLPVPAAASTTSVVSRSLAIASRSG